jgi:CRP-like cAMP-binding protein
MTASLNTAHFQHNRILACLPSKERKVLKEAFELVSLQTKEELNEVNTPIRYLHFPVGSAISLIVSEPGGGTVEVAVVGMEGCTGSTVAQGDMKAPCRVIVQVGGLAVRLSVSSLLKRLSQLPFLRYALSRFSATMLREAIISVGCSQLHSVEQRVGRWLLAHQHRTGRSAFPFTHDFLAEQLGVQRATISEALASLQDRKIIRYAYRQVELCKVRTMQELSCECFPRARAAINEFLRDMQTHPHSASPTLSKPFPNSIK